MPFEYSFLPIAIGALCTLVFRSFFSVQLSGDHSLRTLWSCAYIWHDTSYIRKVHKWALWEFFSELSFQIVTHTSIVIRICEKILFRSHIQRQAWWVLVRCIAVYSQYETVQKMIVAGIGNHRPFCTQLFSLLVQRPRFLFSSYLWSQNLLQYEFVVFASECLKNHNKIYVWCSDWRLAPFDCFRFGITR